LEFLLIKGWLNNVLASGLKLGFTFKHSLTKELKSALHFEGYLNPWTGLSFSCHIAISGLICELGTTP
jgi:hypothetical protein